MTTAAESPGSPRLIALGWESLKLGAVAFGGLGSTLAPFQRRLGDERGRLDQTVISEATS